MLVPLLWDALTLSAGSDPFLGPQTPLHTSQRSSRQGSWLDLACLREETAGPRSHTDCRPQTGLLELTFRNLVEDWGRSQVLWVTLPQLRFFTLTRPGGRRFRRP